jgi:hypothetical protein
MYFCAYDDKGDLFVDGQYDHQGTFELDELPKGSSKFKSIKLTQPPQYPLDIQWAGQYVALAASSTVIDHVSVKGSKGRVVGTTLLSGPASIIEVQFWTQGGRIVVPYGAGSSPDEVGFWKYPTGGRVRKSIYGSSEQFGTVVSLARR